MQHQLLASPRWLYSHLHLSVRLQLYTNITARNSVEGCGPWVREELIKLDSTSVLLRIRFWIQDIFPTGFKSSQWSCCITASLISWSHALPQGHWGVPHNSFQSPPPSSGTLKRTEFSLLLPLNSGIISCPTLGLILLSTILNLISKPAF